MKANRLLDTVKEYARKLPDDDVRYLNVRLNQRIGSDVAEAIDYMQRHDDLNHWLSQAKSAGELYDMLDLIDLGVQNETKRRFSGHDKEKYRN